MELFFNKNYRDKLNSDSKILYGFLLNRLTLLAKNNWIDENGNVVTSHTTNLVPFIVTDKNLNIENVNKLSDIAPFILNYMNLNLPDEMK